MYNSYNSSLIIQCIILPENPTQTSKFGGFLAAVSRGGCFWGGVGGPTPSERIGARLSVSGKGKCGFDRWGGPSVWRQVPPSPGPPTRKLAGLIRGRPHRRISGCSPGCFARYRRNRRYIFPIRPIVMEDCESGHGSGNTWTRSRRTRTWRPHGCPAELVVELGPLERSSSAWW